MEIYLACFHFHNKVLIIVWFLAEQAPSITELYWAETETDWANTTTKPH